MGLACVATEAGGRGKLGVVGTLTQEMAGEERK